MSYQKGSTMLPFRVIEFQLHQFCNARCIYCAYEQKIPKINEYMPLDVIDRTLKQERPEWVWFEGGEVTMSDQSKDYLLEAMAIAEKYNVKNRINTNAQNLDPDCAMRFARGGLKFACVSFDSLDPDNFSKLRGYDIKDGLSRLTELKQNVIGLCDAGITVNVEATVTRYNVGQLDSLYDYVEKLASPGRDILMGAQCLVATKDELFELYPSMKELYESLSALIKKAKRGKIPARICCSPLVKCQYPELYEPHTNVIWVDCSCGYDYVHIRASGDVHLCGFWDHRKPIGNLHTASLKTIWESSSIREAAMNTLPDGCGDCIYWEGEDRCHNTCFSVAYRKTGSFENFSYPLTTQSIQDARKR